VYINLIEPVPFVYLLSVHPETPKKSLRLRFGLQIMGILESKALALGVFPDGHYLVSMS